MPDWIHLLPDNAILALSVAIVVGATFAAFLVCRYVLRFRVPPEQGDVAWSAYQVVVSLTALVLAFSLVQAQVNLREVEADLRREASTLLEVDHEMLHLGAPAAGLRAGLAEYGRAILADEWPRLASGGRSRRADDILVGLRRAARGIEPTEPTGSQAPPRRDALLRELDQLSDLREERLTSATLRLPRAFWRATAALVLVTVVLAGATPWTARHLLSVLSVSAALAVLVALVAIVDVPFRGESAVRPTELRHAVEVITTWQE
jgi:hypothetical protein